MVLKVVFIGLLASVAGKRQLILRYQETQVKGVLKSVVSIVPVLGSELLDARTEEPRTDLLMLINGREISVLNGLDTTLKDGDELTIVPVAHGG